MTKLSLKRIIILTNFICINITAQLSHAVEPLAPQEVIDFYPTE